MTDRQFGRAVTLMLLVAGLAMAVRQGRPPGPPD
jgi:hypothetical protein